METQLSALDLYYLIKESQKLVGGKIDKIYHPQKNELLIQFHVPNLGKNILKVLTPITIHLTSYKSEQKSPSGFCTYLRKKLNNARLRKIQQLEFERIVKLNFETKETKFSLIIELFSKGNILLVENNVILSATEYHIWKDRAIKPKEQYNYPKKQYNFLTLTEQQLKTLLKESDKESMVKALAIELGLGGLYAEEACHTAKIDKNNKPKETTNTKKLFDALQDLKNKKIDPHMTKNKIIPFRLEHIECKKIESKTYNEAIDIQAEQKTETEKPKNKELEKIERIIDQQKSKIKELEIKETDSRKKADLIYTNYKLVSEILKQIKEARKKLSLNEMKEKLKQNKIIKYFDTKEKTITVDLK